PGSAARGGGRRARLLSRGGRAGVGGRRVPPAARPRPGPRPQRPPRQGPALFLAAPRRRHCSNVPPARRRCGVKLLFLNPTGHVGGAERVLLGVLKAMRDRRPDDSLHLLTLSDGDLVTAARRLGVTAAVLPTPHALGRLG